MEADMGRLAVVQRREFGLGEMAVGSDDSDRCEQDESRDDC